MKGKKIVLPVLLTSLAVSPVVANIATAASAPIFADEIESVVAATVNVKNRFKESYPKNEEIAASEMPLVTVAAGVQYVVVVYGPNGKEVQRWYSNPDTGAGQVAYTGATFTPTLKGTYTFKFKTISATTAVTLCDDIYLNVTADAYKLASVANDYWALPSVVNTGRQIKLSVPTLTQNGEDIAVIPFSGTVEPDGTGYDATGATGLLVQVIGPSVTKYYKTYTEATETEPAYYAFNADTAGRYTINYLYFVAGKKVATLGNKTLRAVDNYSIADQYKLEFSLNSSIDSVSKVLGNTITLPTVKAINSKASSTESVNAYTRIKVTYIGGSDGYYKDRDNAVVGTPEAVSYVTDYRYEYKWAGNYRVEYEVSIPNLGVTAAVLTKYINGVTDSVKPKITLTEGYEWNTEKTVATFDSGSLTVTDLTQDDILAKLADYDLSYLMGSVYELDTYGNATVVVPAMFATDNYDNPAGIRIERSVYREGTKLTVADVGANETLEMHFGEDTVLDNEHPENSVFKYGKFTVRYYAYDKTHEANPTTAEYTFEVKENGSLQVGKPTVYMQYFDNTKVLKGESVSVNKPTAVDYKSQDSTLEIRTYYYIGARGLGAADLVDGETIIAGATELKAVDYKNGAYVVNVPEYLESTQNTLYVFATARNNYNHANAGVAVRTFTINGTDAGMHEPTFAITQYNYEGDSLKPVDTFVRALADVNDLGYDTIDVNGLLKADSKEPFGQLDIVNLPKVQFTDEDATGLSVRVKLYYNANGEYDEIVNSKLYTQPTITVLGDTYYLEGGSFEATYAGMYTVVYSATDLGGNTVSQAYGIMIRDTVAPTIIVADLSKFGGEHEVGTQFTVPEVQIKDNGVESVPATQDWFVEAPNGSYVEYNKPEGFTPHDTGDYYIYYVATDGSANEATSQKYHITVVAKEELDLEFTTLDYEATPDWTEADKTAGFKTIEIPNATVTMPYLGESVDVDITVKNSSGKTKTVTYVDAEYSKFEADAEGVYTVTYTAYDRFNRKAEDTLEIRVGDCNAPEFSWKSTSSLPASETTVGSSWTFDVSMMDVTDDNGNTIANGGITYTEVMTAPDGSTVSKSNGAYSFDQVGSYNFTITFTDKAGNKDSENLSITVNAKEENTTTHTSNAVSTILIIASVVVLAGVVTYFVLSGRKKPTTAKADNKKMKEKK